MGLENFVTDAADAGLAQGPAGLTGLVGFCGQPEEGRRGSHASHGGHRREGRWTRDHGLLRAAAERELKRLSFLSHDLRNNLNAINLHLKLLQRRLAGHPDFAEELSLLGRAQQAITQTTEGMGRLLTYARLCGQSATEARPVALGELAEDAAAQHLAEAKLKAVDLSVEVPPDAVVRGDRALIALVLQNLLGNALKYSTRGTVRVRARRDPPAQGRLQDGWVLSVSDEGPGIAPEELGNIFAEFERGGCGGLHELHRLHALREPDGVGLGLAIASEAARLLGAELSVRSRPGIGSTFSLGFAPCPSPGSLPSEDHRAGRGGGSSPAKPAAPGRPFQRHWPPGPAGRRPQRTDQPNPL